MSPAELELLAASAAVEPALRWRGRLERAAELPARCRRPLSQEFELLVIRDVQTWSQVRAAVGLPDESAGPDLTAGAIVGLVGWVGEPAWPVWPLHLRAVRMRAGLGWVVFDFQAGLYHPVLAAAFVELGYV
ncbi:MAG: hypothetical protein ACE5K7_04845, partial [Phycisphaerae bacterium]